MLGRRIEYARLKELIADYPVVGILGPRQIGKTTLALAVAARSRREVTHFDLENPRDIARLTDESTTLEPLRGLVILDEIQRRPELFMTLRVLAYMSTHKSHRQLTDIESVEGTMMMMGAPKFFATFSDLTLVEDVLKPYPAAHLGLMRVIARAHRASAFAGRWAVHRRDLDVKEILTATQLHDMAEMLLYCFAPALALKLADLQRRNPSLRSNVAQKEVLGIELQELELALMQRWMLPELLVRMIDDAHVDHPRVRNVACAVNLARHSAHGWDDPALPDDYCDISRLLNVTPQHVAQSVRPLQG